MAHTSTPSESSDHKEHDLDLNQALKWILPSILGLLAVSMLFFWQQNQGSSVRSEVLQAYSTATSAEELEAIAKGYPDQPEAALALLQAAAVHFNDREFDAALASYDAFLSTYGDHSLREYAEWGLWMTQEQLGDLEPALNGFKSITVEDLLYPQALLAQARVLEKQSLPQEAIKVYQEVQNTFPETPWAQQAEIFAQQAALTPAE